MYWRPQYPLLLIPLLLAGPGAIDALHEPALRTRLDVRRAADFLMGRGKPSASSATSSATVAPPVSYAPWTSWKSDVIPETTANNPADVVAEAAVILKEAVIVGQEAVVGDDAGEEEEEGEEATRKIETDAVSTSLPIEKDENGKEEYQTQPQWDRQEEKNINVQIMEEDSGELMSEQMKRLEVLLMSIEPRIPRDRTTSYAGRESNLVSSSSISRPSGVEEAARNSESPEYNPPAGVDESALEATLRRFGLPYPPLQSEYASAPPGMGLVVDELLLAVAGSNRGIDMTNEERTRVAELICTLEGTWTGNDAFAPPYVDYLFRNGEVVYVGQASSDKANAAGGQFRGKVGRLLFKTTGLYQHVLRRQQRQFAVNLVAFKLLRFIPGCAVLVGPVEREMDIAGWSATYGRSLSPNTVLAAFDSPRVALLRPRNFLSILRQRRQKNDAGNDSGEEPPVRRPLLPPLRVGPPSNVHLDTTYLDSRIRISRGGSSGTAFVFTACKKPDANVWEALAAAPEAEDGSEAQRSESNSGLGSTSLSLTRSVSAKKLGCVCLAAATAIAAAGARKAALLGGTFTARWPGTVAAAGLAAAGGKLILSTGGIVVSSSSSSPRIPAALGSVDGSDSGQADI